jgi:hypothetical protein
VSAVLVVAIFLWPPYFASHYSAFLAPFLAMAVSLPATRAMRSGLAPGLAQSGLILVGVAIVAGAVAQAPTGNLSLSRRASPSVVGRVVPAGACVATDQASFLLLANRFTSNVPGCSQMVDGLGTDLALGRGRRPSSGAAQVPAVAAAWNHAFSNAGYVLLSGKSSLRIPWTAQLRGYFNRNFRYVLHGYGYKLYKRTAPGTGNAIP